ncbi:hypothetical protein E2562_009224 [Oryza meyeriana var. granulata]|uniref:Uncharacterized protein n=1 Tax=Oryza meyeriana var. granulata TaxID=110450 RepID=A0A6G1D1M0_9ORYZ|nr:hypothetical protein E2562_009224 [Oryza meyeriana var. granulata]
MMLLDRFTITLGRQFHDPRGETDLLRGFLEARASVVRLAVVARRRRQRRAWRGGSSGSLTR